MVIFWILTMNSNGNVVMLELDNQEEQQAVCPQEDLEEDDEEEEDIYADSESILNQGC